MQILTSTITVETLLTCAFYVALAFTISGLAVFGGSLFPALAGQFRYQKSKLSVFAKGARQLALLGLIFGWLLLVCLRVWLYRFPSAHFEFCWLGMVVAVLLQSIHFAYWKKLAKNFVVLHKLILLFNALLAMSTATLAILLLRIQIQALFPDSFPVWGVMQPLRAANLWPFYDMTFWGASAALSILLIWAAPTAWASLCLPLYRKYQDFGRDHYRTMVSWCALWARNTWLALWLAQAVLVLAGIWLQWQTHTALVTLDTELPRLLSMAIWQLVWLLPVLLWHVVQKKEQPLRHKGLLFFALLACVSFI